MTRSRVVAVALLIALASSTATTEAQAPKFSPAFREAALRASDAIDRVPSTISQDGAFPVTPVTQMLMIDADKAVAEARYKAVSPTEKSFVIALQSRLGALKMQALYSLLNPQWKLWNERHLLCFGETLALLHAEDVAPAALAEAREGKCSKASSAWWGSGK